MGSSFVCVLLIMLSVPFKMQAQQRLYTQQDTTTAIRNLKVLPQNFYIQHLGFFCKKESQLQQLTRLNLFLRLGAKNDIDYLERKPNTYRY